MDSAVDAYFYLRTSAEKAGESPADFALRLWTADKVDGLGSYKLYSMLNEVIRNDNISSAAFKPAITLVCMMQHHLNANRRYGIQTGPTHWPKGPNAVAEDQSTEANTSWRGAQLPEEHLQFYGAMLAACSTDPQAVYRIPGLVATSFSRGMAVGFMQRAQRPRVLYKILLKDPDWHGGCMQVNYLEKSEFAEKEFLFSAFSAFRVLAIDDSQLHVDNPQDGCNVEITIEAAVDNKLSKQNAPSAPWY